VSNGFLAPIETDSIEQINTGIAIMNLEDEEVTCDLTLRDAEGIAVVTAEITLPSKGHLARFVGELEWSVNVDFSNFQGILSVDSCSRIAATVIQTRSNQFATMPVAAK
jgi:hypothetical protein